MTTTTTTAPTTTNGEPPQRRVHSVNRHHLNETIRRLSKPKNISMAQSIHLGATASSASNGVSSSQSSHQLRVPTPPVTTNHHGTPTHTSTHTRRVSYIAKQSSYKIIYLFSFSILILVQLRHHPIMFLPLLIIEHHQVMNRQLIILQLLQLFVPHHIGLFLMQNLQQNHPQNLLYLQLSLVQNRLHTVLS